MELIHLNTVIISNKISFQTAIGHLLHPPITNQSGMYVGILNCDLDVKGVKMIVCIAQ